MTNDKVPGSPRHELVLKTARRAADAVMAQLEQRTAQQPTKYGSSAFSKTLPTEELIDVCRNAFQDACIALLDKIQFEDREAAQVLVAEAMPDLDRLRSRTLTAFMRGRGVNPGAINADTYRIRGELEPALRKMQESLLDEFVLGVTRGGRGDELRRPVTSGTYVNLDRLDQLRNLVPSGWDFASLIRMCEELNIALLAEIIRINQ